MAPAPDTLCLCLSFSGLYWKRIDIRLTLLALMCLLNLLALMCLLNCPLVTWTVPSMGNELTIAVFLANSNFALAAVRQEIIHGWKKVIHLIHLIHIIHIIHYRVSLQVSTKREVGSFVTSTRMSWQGSPLSGPAAFYRMSSRKLCKPLNSAGCAFSAIQAAAKGWSLRRRRRPAQQF